jgi:amino acid transporter
MENPRVMLPKALYMSVSIVIVIYVVVSLAVIANLAIPAIVAAKDYALARAAQPFLGLAGFRIMALAALFSTSSAINATLYGGANVSYIIAKEGELPHLFDRKVWRHGTEGLVITSALVIISVNVLNLDGIAMLGSASFLIIYALVNFGHLRIYRQTRANPFLILASMLGCIAALAALVYYVIENSLVTLIVLAAVVGFSFAAEWTYRRYTSRTLRASTDG